ncbi:triple tyrosine motif-containing protein [uncultured Lacinutrix sp.]|uniref:helix-turn-helix and ligand-binding sensor domain-containing protein n=1 Tax=uncultured Lacinutrix sp. TaxID=574032 RepID=UPI0026308125|nr:triple tyrosine motif-containing protein [uncultured Lacinutrix sp.]
MKITSNIPCKAILLFIFVSFCAQIFAQELPPINVYTPQQYGGENQNWDISQDENNAIYVANNAGLLKYDGERWHLYSSPNETIMRSVNAINGYVYSGFYMEFGYWKENELGILDYTSLSKKLKTPLIDDEQFWDIIALEDWILFQSLNRIYIYNLKEESFNIIESKTNITKMYMVGDSIYFQRIDNGIFKIENGDDILVTNDPVIKENIVINIIKKNDALLIETQEDGFYTLKNNVLKPWNAKVNNELKTLSVYNSIELNDGSLALGTISKGIIILDKEGFVKYRIDQRNGLINNTILSLFEDQEDNIWLGLDNGISCLNMYSHFKVFKDFNGELGAVYTAAIYNDILYLGTNQGLFYKTIGSAEKFSFVKGTHGQVWSLLEFDDTLFCGHNSGTFIIKNKKAKKISNVEGAWNIKPIKGQPNMLLQGNYKGLNILKKEDNEWSFGYKIDGFDISSRFFEFLNKNEILLNHEYKGVLKISLNKEFSKVTDINVVPISKGLKSSLSKHNDNILYAYKDGIFRYNVLENKFVKDTLLMNLYNSRSFISGRLIAEPKANRLWGFSNNEISFISPGKLSNKPEVNSIPLPYELRKSVTSYENILSIDDQQYLLGTTFGYILINLEKPFDKEYKTNINTIIVTDKHNSNNVDKAINKSVKGEFDNKENSLEISYSILEYNKYLKAEYQYQLEGIYDEWSEWSSNAEELFENLPFGDYTFNVRGRINNNITQNVASYSFSINRPWYLSNIAIVFYFIGLVLFSLMMHNIYKSYYRKQRQQLLEQKNKELELKELVNQEQSMRFKNESLTKDIESKNRELAISTMSLIKKNEFLNSVKGELININESNVKPVIKIIDKNLNNTDDWKLFQEAFNNADKDFLKKIKAIHPSLTPNDLRLCAYLRLNLSSKEIAPLLNISPRSVEVKRYRLRKKINLPHESSLTNYIIEL